MQCSQRGTVRPLAGDPLNVVITGVGGQGNVLASQILGRAAILKGLKVTVGETFGLSQRGGPVSSHVRFSRRRCYGPLIPPHQGDIVLGLEPLETLRAVTEYGNAGTVVVANARPIYPINVIAGDNAYPDVHGIREALEARTKKCFWLDGTASAVALGGPIMLNMIMVGALCALEVFPLGESDILGVLGDIFPERKIEGNRKALGVGKEMIGRYED